MFDGVDVVFHDEFAQRTGFFGGMFFAAEGAAGDGAADGEQFACGVSAVGFRQVGVLHGRSFGCPVREKRPRRGCRCLRAFFQSGKGMG